jgi:hypothetical protein
VSEDKAVAWLRSVIEGDLERFTAKPGPMAGKPGERQSQMASGLDDSIAGCEAKLALLAEHAQWGPAGPCSRCADWETRGAFDLLGVLVPWPRRPAGLLASACRHRPGFAEHWETETASASG